MICDPEKITEHGCIGPPDLVVEVLSPSTMKKDFAEKFFLYERRGVREYWIVDPGSRTVHRYLLVRDERSGESRFGDAVVFSETEMLRSQVLEGLDLSLQEVF